MAADVVDRRGRPPVGRWPAQSSSEPPEWLDSSEPPDPEPPEPLESSEPDPLEPEPELSSPPPSSPPWSSKVVTVSPGTGGGTGTVSAGSSSPPRLRRRRCRCRCRFSAFTVAGASVSPALSGSAPSPMLSPEIEFASRPMPTAAASPAMARAAPVAKRRKVILSPRLAPPRQGFVKGRVSSLQSVHGVEGHLGAGAARGAVRERDLAAPARRERLDHREAQAGAGGAAAASRAAVEALEHALQLVSVEPRALVQHRDPHALPVARPGERDGGAGRRVVERVLREVGEDGGDVLGRGRDRGRRARLDTQLVVRPLRGRLPAATDGVDHLRMATTIAPGWSGAVQRRDRVRLGLGKAGPAARFARARCAACSSPSRASIAPARQRRRGCWLTPLGMRRWACASRAGLRLASGSARF